MRTQFSTTMTLNWISIADALPLDEYKDKSDFGILTDVLVLIHNEEEPNDEVSIVQIYFLLDNDSTEKWTWANGEEYHDCHAQNIKYWAEVPTYDWRSVPTKKELGII